MRKLSKLKVSEGFSTDGVSALSCKRPQVDTLHSTTLKRKSGYLQWATVVHLAEGVVTCSVGLSGKARGNATRSVLCSFNTKNVGLAGLVYFSFRRNGASQQKFLRPMESFAAQGDGVLNVTVRRVPWI